MGRRNATDSCARSPLRCRVGSTLSLHGGGAVVGPLERKGAGAAMSGTSPDSLDTQSFGLTLSSARASVREARLFVQSHCRARQFPENSCETAVLLTSEVVTNALIHGRSEAHLVVRFTRSGIRVEVGDENSRHPEQASVDADALHGRGLTILELLATRWGVRDEAYGKTVWFEVDARLP